MINWHYKQSMFFMYEKGRSKIEYIAYVGELGLDGFMLWALKSQLKSIVENLEKMFPQFGAVPLYNPMQK